MIIDLNKQDKTPIEFSGYFRLFGDRRLAYLIRRIHATVISNGSELERMICENTRANGTTIADGTSCEDLIYYYQNHCLGQTTYFNKLNVSKPSLIRAGLSLESKNKISVDGVWILPDKSVLVCEYKDGDGFDTKKSDAEIKSLQKILKWMKHHGVSNSQAVMVLWNCPDLSTSSVKSKEAKPYLATADDFINMLPSGALRADKINEKRYGDREQNLNVIVNYLKDCISDKE